MKGRRIEILHVAAHLGGGVGRVLLNYLAAVKDGEATHSLFCLDYANRDARARAEAEGIHLRDRLGLNHQALGEAAGAADLAVLHWWNHPLAYAWLCSGPWPPARLLLWSHVSGLTAPQVITPALAAFPDLLAAANPVSFRAPALAGLSVRDQSRRLRLLFSSAGLAHVEGTRLRSHYGFRVGYLGTVDYAKMHPDFIDLCLSANLPEAVFAVAGGPSENAFKQELEQRGVADRFEAPGVIADVSHFLAGLDVFGYPLNPEHYGTGEQALIEAQAVGVPPVVLAGGAEEFVVEDGLTGLTARGPDDYGRCLRRLREDEILRQNLSAAARRRARERFGLEKTVAGLEDLYRELMARPKQTRCWPEWRPGLPPWRIFLASQGETATFFAKIGRNASADEAKMLSRASFAPTRGSVFHYASFFPEDIHLKQWGDFLSSYAPQPGAAR
jgi:glycosyltransferase involved in cell wall biosynthesis